MTTTEIWQKFGDTGTAPVGNQENSVVRHFAESVSCDEWGIITANYVAQGHYNSLVNFCRTTKNHPDMDFLRKSNWGIQRLEGDVGRATIVFKGVGKKDNIWKYTMETETASMNIETHPFFDHGKAIPDGRTEVEADTAYGYRFGGNSGDPIQAEFDGDSFKEFPVDADFDLPGIEDYYMMGTVMTCTHVYYVDDEHAQVDEADSQVFAVGKRTKVPSKFRPKLKKKNKGDVTDERDWLLQSATVTTEGSARKIIYKYRLSGYRGWNRLVYDYEEPLTVKDNHHYVSVQN